MTAPNIYVHVEWMTKEKAETVLEQLGITMSMAVEMYLRQIVLQQGIPFEMKLPGTEMAAEKREKNTKK